MSQRFRNASDGTHQYPITELELLRKRETVFELSRPTTIGQRETLQSGVYPLSQKLLHPHNYHKERAFASQTFTLCTDNKGGSNIRTHHIILFTEFSE